MEDDFLFVKSGNLRPLTLYQIFPSQKRSALSVIDSL